MIRKIKVFLTFLKQDASKSLIIVAQIIISVFSITFLLIPIIKSLETRDLINKNSDTYAIFSSNINLLQAPDTYFNKKYEEIRNFITGIDGVTNIGTAYTVPTKEMSFTTLLYDKVLFEYIKLEIDEGEWIYEKNINDNTSTPIVISSDLGKTYKIGSIIEIEIPKYSNDKDKEDYINLSCQVVGILKQGSYVYYGSSNHTDSTISDLFVKTNSTDKLVILPNILENKPIYAANDGILIKYDSNKLDNIINEVSKSGIGKIYTIDNLEKNEGTNIIIYNENEIYQFIIVFVFILISIGGYSTLTSLNYKRLLTIYYICGLTWKKGILYIGIKNLLIIILPAILTSVLSNLLVCYYKTIYTFNLKVILITVALYSLIAILIFLITIANLRKYKPNEFLKEVD